MSDHKEPNYFAVWAWLLLLTITEIATTRLPIPRITIAILLVGQASTKALLVAMFFMHLKFENKVLAMIAFTLLIERSRLGQYFLAVREDEQAAEASGVDTYRYKTVAIGVSAALTALAGTFYAQFYLYVNPASVLIFEPQLNMMLGTMVGGAGTALGPVLGSMLFSGIGEVLRNLPFENTRQVATASKMLYAILLMVVVIYLPGGLISLRARKRKA